MALMIGAKYWRQWSPGQKQRFNNCLKVIRIVRQLSSIVQEALAKAVGNTMQKAQPPWAGFKMAIPIKPQTPECKIVCK